MPIDEGTVLRIARLARIEVAPEEASALVSELSQILEWMKQFDEVDTREVEPMTRVAPTDLKQREDVVTDGEIADDILKNAPLTENHYFVVPKVVE